jgi:hypothetical protein
VNSPLDQAQLGLKIARCMTDMVMLAAGPYDECMTPMATDAITDFAHLMAQTDAGKMIANQGNPVLSPLIAALQK